MTRPFVYQKHIILLMDLKLISIIMLRKNYVFLKICIFLCTQGPCIVYVQQHFLMMMARSALLMRHFFLIVACLIAKKIYLLLFLAIFCVCIMINIIHACVVILF